MPISEDHPQEPDSPYGVSKLAAEKLCLVFNKLYGMKNVCLRYFNVYGVRQRYDAYGNVIPIFGERALQGLDLTILGDGEQTRDFVDVRDVALANVTTALHTHARGVFNLGSATRVTISWLAQTIVELTGGDVRIEYAPAQSKDVRDSLADVSRAAAAFGYASSVDLRIELAEYFSWLDQDRISLTKRGEVL